ncbi:hypothetical protein STANM309S_06733 [Streptomyces tanashiensis]
MERVLLADDERVGLESTYVSEARVPRLDTEFDPDSSFYAYLHDRLGISFGDADERIETVLSEPPRGPARRHAAGAADAAAPPRLAGHLGAAPGAGPHALPG